MKKMTDLFASIIKRKISLWRRRCVCFSYLLTGKRFIIDCSSDISVDFNSIFMCFAYQQNHRWFCSSASPHPIANRHLNDSKYTFMLIAAHFAEFWLTQHNAHASKIHLIVGVVSVVGVVGVDVGGKAKMPVDNKKSEQICNCKWLLTFLFCFIH